MVVIRSAPWKEKMQKGLSLGTAINFLFFESESHNLLNRHFLDTPENERPVRFDELVAVHGLLDPLVNVDLTPEKVGSEHQTHQLDHKR